MNQTIHIIHGFISDDKCNEIRSDLNKKLWDAADPFIQTGFSVPEEESVNYYYHNASELNEVFNKMGRIMSEYYGHKVELKSMFHSVMNPGALNPLHWDNYIENGEQDISALLYLNNDFQGGDLYFPDQDIRIKPEPGLFVFFNGTEDYHHTVEVVTEGRREALVGFYWPTDKRKSVKP